MVKFQNKPQELWRAPAEEGKILVGQADLQQEERTKGIPDMENAGRQAVTPANICTHHNFFRCH